MTFIEQCERIYNLYYKEIKTFDENGFNNEINEIYEVKSKMKNVISFNNKRYIIKKNIGSLDLTKEQIKELSETLNSDQTLLFNRKINEYIICEIIKEAEIT